MAQVTTSGISGKVTSELDKEAIIGATITAKHVPSGTVYRAVTNVNGRYALERLRAGGPYEVEVSYIGYRSKKFTDLNLTLGQSTVLDVWLSEASEVLKEVEIYSTGRSSMRTDRAGAVKSVSAAEMVTIPTVSRSLNDILKMTPQGGNTGNGFAVGGGNYRQSYVTVDGAAFNNAFGIGSNLPGNGSPISLDALDQITVSVSPFDVRQSGFTGGAINAVTKSGTNDFKANAYAYYTNQDLRGAKVGDVELVNDDTHTATYGLSLGGPIVKDKLFFFVNGEYEDNTTAGTGVAIRQPSNGSEWGGQTIYNRPTAAELTEISNYLQQTYGYNPGKFTGFTADNPAYKILARVDWNINDNNKLNVRFSKSHSKSFNNPSNSTNPLKDTEVYTSGGRANSGRTSYYTLPFESSYYSQVRNFTSFAAELNSKWGIVNNTLRATYSYQDEPRSYEGGLFPSVDILKDGAAFTSFGPDPFTVGNLRAVKTFVATDEVTFQTGIHNWTAGVQFETNKATNGYQQGGSGYYAFASWQDFVNGAKPSAYLLTTGRALDGSAFEATMRQNQFSYYLQDQMNISDRFRLTAGLRFEVPIYPELKDNYNVPFAQLAFREGAHYATDQLPIGDVTISPRVGFNWDVTGDQKLVLRGGTGYFVGRLPFVWLVSAVGNANCGQVQYYYTNPSNAIYGQPSFDPTVAGQLSQLNITAGEQIVPPGPTIIDTKLMMNAVWKSSLALDAKLPGGIDASIEGVYSKEFNPAVVTNENVYWNGVSTFELTPGDVRRAYSSVNKSNQAYYITNGGHKAYSYSITAQLAKKFDFGLDLSAAYTYSKAKSYGDGIGDQVSSAYNTNRYSRNGINDMELGYGTYVSPHRLLVSAAYRKEYAGHMASTIGLVYEGMNLGYAGGYTYTRYSYTYTANVVGDGGAQNLLYVPGSRAELDSWNFSDYEYTGSDKAKHTYTAAEQREDFWNYIQQDSYLKKHTGEYADRGGVTMPWHHQLDLKFAQDFFIKTGKYRNTLQLGVDIKNLPNLINSEWGLYKQVNNFQLLKYVAADKSVQFQRRGTERLTETFSNYNAFGSTYSIQFSVRYIFN